MNIARTPLSMHSVKRRRRSLHTPDAAQRTAATAKSVTLRLPGLEQQVEELRACRAAAESPHLSSSTVVYVWRMTKAVISPKCPQTPRLTVKV